MEVEELNRPHNKQCEKRQCDAQQDQSIPREQECPKAQFSVAGILQARRHCVLRYVTSPWMPTKGSLERMLQPRLLSPLIASQLPAMLDDCMDFLVGECVQVSASASSKCLDHLT
ncbi:MAG: hypothetical protein JWP89_1588 [Schlesneria sp.]|nr:hypothetical protein [Schlesneria sp.]